MPIPETRRALTMFEGLAAVATAGSAAFCLQFPFFVRPRLVRMFADFGGDVPRITQLGLTPWFPIVLGMIPAFALAGAVAGENSPSARRGLITGAFALSLVSSGLCMYAMYVPIFSIAGSIK